MSTYKEKKLKKPKTFKRVLTWSILSLMGIGVLLLITLGIYLYTYEQQHPKYLVNKVVEQYQSKQFDDILALSNKKERAALKKALPSLIHKNKLFSFQSYEDKDKIEYTIVNGKQKLSTVTLVKEQKKDMFGIQKLRLKKIDHYAAYPYRIHYFENTNVVIQGKEVHQMGKEESTSTQFSQLGYAEIKTYTYAYDSFEPIEDIQASYQGNACTKVVDETGYDITFYPTIPQANVTGIQNTLTQFSKEYVRYTTLRGVKAGNVLRYVTPNSALAQLITSYSNTWGEVIQTENFSAIDMSNPIQYHDRIFSYDVHMVYTVSADNGEQKQFPIDYRMYVVSTGYGYQVFDMERISKQEKRSVDDTVASSLAPSLYVKENLLSGACSDNDIATSYTFQEGDALHIKSDQAIGAIYIKWGKTPIPYSMSINKKTSTKGKQGQLHELIKIKSNAKEVVLKNLVGNEMAEIVVYSKGTLPKDVQDWKAPLEKSDIVAFPTHADDDALYMGALLSEYAAKGKKIQLVFLTNSNSSANTSNAYVRQHELLDGMWEMGLRNYPVIGEFQDFGSRNLHHAKSLYDHETMLKFQVASIRRFKPDIVVGHDENGEYGHGVHMLNTELLKQAVQLANEPTFDQASFDTYGAHKPKKTYFHLYAQHQIVLDVHKQMQELDGLSPFQVASNAYGKHQSQHKYNLAVEDFGNGDCRLFGLFDSTVGYEFTSNNIFEGIE